MTRTNPTPGPDTISRHYYLGQDAYTTEKERTFSHESMCMGHLGTIPGPGDFFPIEIAGRSIVIVRQKDASLCVDSSRVAAWSRTK
jgi:choline monooxygenase